MRTKKLSLEQGKNLNISQFPNFSKTGSIKGMKDMYYGKGALLVKCGSWIYCVGDIKKPCNKECLSLGESIYFFHAE